MEVTIRRPKQYSVKICISYRKRHFALSGPPLLYSCRVLLSPVWIIQMLSLHSLALVTWLHVRIRSRPLLSSEKMQTLDTRIHTSFSVSARIHRGNTPPYTHTSPPLPFSPSHPHSPSAPSASVPLARAGIYIKGGDWRRGFNAVIAAAERRMRKWPGIE